MKNHLVRDPLMREMFSHQKADIFTQRIGSEHTPLSNDLLDAPPDYYRSVLDLDLGSYDLALVSSYYLAYAVPSVFAQQNLMHLQLLASVLTSSDHYTRREGLRSYLCAQTFYGSAELRYEGCHYTLGPGDVFLIDCMRPHEYRALGADGWGYRIIHFSGPAIASFHAQLLEGGAIVTHFGEQHAIFRHTKELYAARRKGAPDQELEEHAQLTAIVTELLRRLPRFRALDVPERIAQVVRYLDEHASQASLSLDEVAQSFHTSKYHLSREFKRHVGKTVFAYVTERRMDLATYLLTTSESSVEQIAYACGYVNVNSFFYAFRKHTGLSPTAYRHRHGRQ